MRYDMRILSLFLMCIVLSSGFTEADEEDDAALFMDDLEERYSLECNTQMVAEWAYIVDVENITAENEANEASVTYFIFQGEAAANVSQYNYDNYSDVSLYREFRFQADQGPGGLSESDLTLYQTLQSTMETIYSTATICPYGETDPTKCTLPLEPDIEDIMATSTNWDELKWVWEQWRNVTGRLMRDNYTDFVALSNEAARLDGYEDTGEYWLNGYTVTQKEAENFGDENLIAIDQEAFKTLVDNVWLDVFESLYKPLHAYVRLRLLDLYPDYINLREPMPANILGNMWAQDWTNIAEYVMPFADEPDFDVTQSMIDNGWNIDMMFTAAEDFFMSIGLYEMTDDFWSKSVINQTAWGKTMICHASAEDFCLGANSTDFRIKMCTQVNMGDLVTVHHEMGHIEYFMAYRDLPHVFRDSANPGFHEAIGDLIALSVSTPDHMENVLGLTSSAPSVTSRAGATNYTSEQKRDINFLMRMALEKIAFLPFGYLIDKYRWGIFDGTISPDNYNSEWWRLREDLQGVVPPSTIRRGEQYFDAGAKYHVPANVPYIRYFVSFIVQFQFHKRLCEAAGLGDNPFKCDIYNNTDAGTILLDALELGFSEPWPLVLNDLGGSYNMDAGPIKEYFQPLMDYLAVELEGVFVGWETDKINPDAEAIARDQLYLMDRNMTPVTVDMVDKSWTYNTNITDFNTDAMNDAILVFSETYRSWWDEVISNSSTDGLSTFTKRQFLMQRSIGTAILDETNLNKLNGHLNSMMEYYSNKVCSFDDMKCDEDKEGYDIDRLELEMASNRDYSELLYYWEKWRDVSGKNMIDDFKSYVNLMNIAASENSFTDAGEMWIEPYTTHGIDDYNYVYTAPQFKSDIQELWNAIRPYYVNLRAYVLYRFKQHDDYKDYFKEDNLIPAHILGNMWAQSWENIYDLVAPFPEPLPDITESLEKTTAYEMFKIAENFYLSLNMFSMTEDFWNNSQLVQPTDGRTVVCHASAWDFYSNGSNNQEDGRFRIKMCTDLNQEDFIVIHHEMGHTQYQMAYSNYDDSIFPSPDNRMPLIYRDGANPGFHEAIGDTIALSVSTPTHLNMIQNYLNVTTNTTGQNVTQTNINFLMKQALAKVAFLPYAYILDLWRWEVFNGTIGSDVYNKEWWAKRIDYQGIRPPITRSPDTDFDIGCKFHVPANVPYIRYFVADILQFQFHEKLCEYAGITEDIFNCDIYESVAAGDALMNMLSKGASEQWQDQLAEFLNSDGTMDSTSIINYFAPLWEFLEKEIIDNGIPTDWSSSADVIGDYINNTDEISTVVPIIVGVVLAVLVAIVLVAFFVGQRKRKRMEKEKEKENGAVGDKGKDNEGLELEETKEDI